MTFGETLIRWSVRLSVLLMLAAWLSLLHRPRSKRTDSIARCCWAAGFLVFLVHLWAAFAYVHRWSHSAAVQDTARQTRDVVGLDWCGGVWFNYLFALLWGADVLWWCFDPASRERRPRWMGGFLHGFLGFVAFNGTVVFATGFSRWLGLAGCGLVMLRVWKKNLPRNTDADQPV